jgi:hypothetical protein
MYKLKIYFFMDIDSKSLITTLRKIPTFIPYILFGLIILFVYWPLRHAGFIADDPQYVWFSATNPIIKILFDPSTYMYINPSNLTPLLGLTFKIDSYLFKTDPTGYNLHSFLSLFITASMFYVFLKQYISRISAFCGTILFIVNPVTIAVTSWFSTIHYIEGMFWALLTLYLVKNCGTLTRTTEGHMYKSVVRGLFCLVSYLIASLYKEVYVVVPAIAFLIVNGNMYERFKKTFPLWIGLLFYIPYRFFMLGGIGGYPGSVWLIGKMIQNFISYPYIAFHLLFGKLWLFGVIFFIATSIIFLVKKRDLFGYATIVILYSVITLPFLPLSNPSLWLIDKMAIRYIFTITVFFITIAAIGLEKLFEKRSLHIVFISTIFFVLLGLWYLKGVEVRDLYKKYRDNSMRDVVQLVEHRDKKFFISNAPRLYDLNWYFNGIKKMYRYFYGINIDTRVVFLESLKFNTPELIQEVLNDINIDNSVKKRLSEEISVFQKNLKKGPLMIEVSWDGYWLNWNFGPLEKGNFCVLFRRTDELYSVFYCVPPNGRYYFPPNSADTLYFRVLYRATDGNEVLSPEFMIEFPSKGNLIYKAIE